jgi:photosystem I subunit XI
MAEEFVTLYKGDPFAGHLATPVSASAFTEAFIGNLPAYRKGLSPLSRGLEVGLAHGYFLIGPWVYFGPLRDSQFAVLGAFISAIGLVILASICLAAYGLVSFQKQSEGPNDLQSAEGWSQFTGGFFIGAMGSAFAAYLLLANLPLLDSMMRGLVNQ